jgi:predicted DNA-binding protein
VNNEIRHIQLRLSPELRDELENLSRRFGISVSDAVRGALLFGIPVFEALTDLQGELAKRLVDVLKRDSRIGRSAQ